MEKSDNRPVALVTGATSGLGLAIAQSFIDAGFIVFGAGRRQNPENLPAGLIYVRTDVTSNDSVEECRNYILSNAGRIDVLVCGAGSGISGSIEDTPISEAQAQLDVNFFGVVRTVQAFLPAMRQQKSGKIIVIGSIAGRIGMPFQAFYSASKFALEGFVESLRHEIRAFNIQACIVEPGDFRTGFTSARRKLVRPGSAYTSQFEKAIGVQEHDELQGALPALAGKRIVQLAGARSLPVRVTIGPIFERFAVWVRRILPDSWFEAFYKIYYKL